MPRTRKTTTAQPASKITGKDYETAYFFRNSSESVELGFWNGFSKSASYTDRTTGSKSAYRELIGYSYESIARRLIANGWTAG